MTTRPDAERIVTKTLVSSSDLRLLRAMIADNDAPLRINRQILTALLDEVEAGREARRAAMSIDPTRETAP